MRTEPGNATPSEDGPPLLLSADSAAQTPMARTAPLILLTMVIQIIYKYAFYIQYIFLPHTKFVKYFHSICKLNESIVIDGSISASIYQKKFI